MDDNLAIPKKSILPASVVAEKLIQRMNEVELHRHTGHSTGYTQLDQQGIRLQPGSVNIIAAHNGIGRYAFSSSLVLNFIQLNQKRVAICNIASDHETSVQALLHYGAGVKLPLIDGDNPSESDRSLLAQEVHSQWIKQIDFIIPNALTISAIEDQLYHLDDTSPSLLVIDSIKKLGPVNTSPCEDDNSHILLIWK